jgi:hypothetical protein
MARPDKSDRERAGHPESQDAAHVKPAGWIDRGEPADLRTPTGTWHLMRGRYGKRKHDKPYPWGYWIAYRTIHLTFTILGALAGILLARYLSPK